MLILIPGATGNLGVRLVRSALRRGHRVRALGRSPSKMPPDLHDQLESFVAIAHSGDVTAFDRGCTGADAVIVAWNEDPRLVLEGQLALLRAAERAGVKRFHAVSWNANWQEMPLRTIESYDAMISFARQTQLTSPIKPLYTFCGVLAETLFGKPGSGSLEGNTGLWIRKENGERAINLVGEGKTWTSFSTEDDVADFSIALTTSDDAERGGFFRFSSDSFSIESLKASYEHVTGEKCTINHVMDVQTCKTMIKQAREDAAEAGDLHKKYKDIVGLVYAVFLEEGSYDFLPVHADRFPGVPRTKLEDYIRANDWV